MSIENLEGAFQKWLEDRLQDRLKILLEKYDYLSRNEYLSDSTHFALEGGIRQVIGEIADLIQVLAWLREEYGR